MANEKRLIYVDEALEELRKVKPKLHTVEMLGFKAVDISAFIQFLENRKIVDAVEVVHGRWVNASGARTICNNCGEYPLYDYFGRQKFSYYCPNCGAKMDGERKDNE